MGTRQSLAIVCATLLLCVLVSANASAQTPRLVQGDQFGSGFGRHSRGYDAKEAQDCLPGIEKVVRRNWIYAKLYSILSPRRQALQRLLAAVDDERSYEALLRRARRIAYSVDGGRLVVTLPDGTVVVDTAREDDPTDVLPSGNSYNHYVEKTVNENHNTRVAILSAQLYPCGIGLESKLSSTTGGNEYYIALRLGRHLNSVGTARLSISNSMEAEAAESTSDATETIDEADQAEEPTEDAEQAEEAEQTEEAPPADETDTTNP